MNTMIKFEETSLNVSEELKSKLISLIPNNVPTKVISIEEKSDNGFSSLLRVAIKSKQNAIKWVEDFEKISSTRHRVNGTFAENTQKIVFKKRYHCHRNTRASYTRAKIPHPRHTDCPGKLCVTIKQSNMPKSKDKYLRKYPCEIDIRFVHNHMLVDDSELDLPTRKFINLYGYNKIQASVMQNDRLNAFMAHSDENDIPSSVYEDKVFSSDTDLKLIIELENVFSFLKDNLLKYPGIFQQPLRQFIENMDNIDSCDDLVLALNSFGKLNTTEEPQVITEYDNNLEHSDYDMRHQLKREHSEISLSD